MDLTKVVLDRVIELESTLSKKTGQRWEAEDLSIVAQVRLSNDAGEATIATIEVGKAKVIEGELTPIKMLGQKELEARIKAVKP